MIIFLIQRSTLFLPLPIWNLRVNFAASLVCSVRTKVHLYSDVKHHRHCRRHHHQHRHHSHHDHHQEQDEPAQPGHLLRSSLDAWHIRLPGPTGQSWWLSWWSWSDYPNEVVLLMDHFTNVSFHDNHDCQGNNFVNESDEITITWWNCFLTFSNCRRSRRSCSSCRSWSIWSRSGQKARRHSDPPTTPRNLLLRRLSDPPPPSNLQ